MQSLLIILPDFLIILLGALLAQKAGFGEAFWKPAENLVFYVLFPPLLFNSIAGAEMTIAGAAQFLTAGVGSMLLAVLIARLLMTVLRDDPVTHASVFQCGFRFNTYIGFAVCLRLFGDEGFALLALLIAFWVPISNTIAVSVLANAVARRDNAANAPAERFAPRCERSSPIPSSSQPSPACSSRPQGSRSRRPPRPSLRISGTLRSPWGFCASARD